MSMSKTSVRDVGILVLRAGVGGALFAHGAQKLFGWFGGGGLGGTAAGAGALLVIGLGTPGAGAAAAGTMAVASSMHAPQGFFSNNGGLEYPAVLGVAATALALTGPGELSIDRLLGHRVNRHWMRAVALGAVAPAVTAVLLRRRKAIAVAAAESAPEVEAPTDPDASI
jgi:putative oxidoreductase